MTETRPGRLTPSCPPLGSQLARETGRKHHTSKLAAFEDLEKVRAPPAQHPSWPVLTPVLTVNVDMQLASFGFRGEALSSLCAIAHVVVTTRTADQAMGTRLVFDAGGRITTREPAAREVC